MRRRRRDDVAPRPDDVRRVVGGTVGRSYLPFEGVPPLGDEVVAAACARIVCALRDAEKGAKRMNDTTLTLRTAVADVVAGAAGMRAHPCGDDSVADTTKRDRAVVAGAA